MKTKDEKFDKHFAFVPENIIKLYTSFRFSSCSKEEMLRSFLYNEKKDVF